jgi:REP element-mobilizing transposase RayT
MARSLRIEFPGAFYHVTARGNEKKKIFFVRSDYVRFTSYLKTAQEKYGYALHGYVLMPNHYHLLVETPNGNLSELMHYINGSYVNTINRRRRRSGHLLQGRYRAILIERDPYLLEVSRYIHLNPVRAGIVTRPEEYAYSSYLSYIGGKKEEILQRDFILNMISENWRQAAEGYKTFAEQAIHREIKNPLKDAYGGLILGSRKFIREAQRRIEEEALEAGGISCRRELRAPFTTDVVIAGVSAQLHISHDDLLNDTGNSRNVTIYLLKRCTSARNKEIGDLFGGLTYSAVAKAYQRFSLRLGREKALAGLIDSILTTLSSVKP